jgi:hypothetical protein
VYIHTRKHGGEKMDGKMQGKQLYFTEQLCVMMNKAWGEGKVSANVERVVRAHLMNEEGEKKLRLQELERELRRFNADFFMGGEIIFPEKETPPAPSPEKATQQ